MGDVALTVPVLKGISRQYPGIEMLMVTRPEFKPFFSSVEGLEFFFPDMKIKHNGISGTIRLFRDIKMKGGIDHVLDLHDVIRSKFLCLLFRLSGVPVSVIDKGRKEKKNVITGKRKKQLKHTVTRYSDVFARAGFPVTPAMDSSFISSHEVISKTASISGQEDILNIGVAPYAKHKLKVWPEENMIRLLELISEKQKSKFWLFGGIDEAEKIKSLQNRIPNSVDLAVKLTLNEELALMSKLDFMLAMDSANMHMAALAGTKVISIWGGTDPMSGFGAWNQPESYSVRIPVEDLTCRPCTTFGLGECKRGDFACMIWLTPELVLKKLIDLKII
jgi:ADP-heptose:LPS heptosyltransferase